MRWTAPPWPLLRLLALTGACWALLTVLLAPAPPARTVLVLGFAALWAWQATRPWNPPVAAVPLLAPLLLLPIVWAPAASGSDGFRPFPFAEGTYADGALAVGAAPIWIHLVVLARGRDLAWSIPAALVAAPLRHLLDGGLPLWPAWIMWGAGFMVLGSAFRVHGMLYEARLRLDREAVAEERRKIAREVHDLVGHGLGVVMLNITAARLATSRGDAGAAGRALEEAERVGRQSVRDVHRGLVLLRDPSAGAAPPAPAPPTAEDTEALVAELRAGGLAVALSTRGDLGTVDPAVGLTIFRVVQEALSNTARHAPGASAAVVVDVRHGAAQVTVTDPGPAEARARSSGGGLGLLGMRERVTALGGTLRAGPDGTGWTVRATIPLAGTAS
ncbi:histidine kinase [Actinomadura luteofluorescens]|uniref:sensor histidine kinase n=1 Tax=Actinomadura luteofluorescens TaxID=46163 RepID=UPI002164470B|nr:histidine kinase [Actinomadura glauciflava]MCR3744834.1 Signal transduction histidine kinase [Actinomadura glauciflava]